MAVLLLLWNNKIVLVIFTNLYSQTCAKDNLGITIVENGVKPKSINQPIFFINDPAIKDHQSFEQKLECCLPVGGLYTQVPLY